MVAEVTITVKNPEKKLTKNHLIYEEFKACEHDPIISELIRETVKEFSDEVEKIQVKILLEVE